MKNVNEVIEEINRDYLEILHSKKYKIGNNLLLLKNSLINFDFNKIYMALKDRYINFKSKKYNEPNTFNIIDDYSTINMNEKIAVYTCIAGPYDTLLEPICYDENIDFFVYTDQPVPEKSRWKKIDLSTIDEIQELDNTRKARYIKTHPHILFKEYGYSLWIDSNIQIFGDIRKYMSYLNPKTMIATNWHPLRNCIFNEAKVCQLKKKDDAETMNKQLSFYESMGMPLKYGLLETNIILRKHNDLQCIDIMEQWWNEILSWSKRDQLSLPFILWKNNYKVEDVGFISTNVRQNPTFRVIPHSYKKYEESENI